MHVLSDYRSRRIRTHTAGVRACVFIAYALVVLTGGHRQHVFAIHHHNERGFFTGQEFFDHHATAGITEGVAGQHVFHGLFGLLQGFGHDHAFTGGQTIGFHHDRRAFLAQVGQRRFYFGEILVIRCRDVMAGQEIFGEGFGAFQLSSAFARAENLQTGGFKLIDDTANQRRFRANDGQADVVVLREFLQCIEIHHIDGDVFQAFFDGGTGIARSNEYFFNQRRL